MTRNLSPFDCDVRIAIVAPILLLIALAAGPMTALGIAAFVVAVEVAATAFSGYSPLKDLVQGLA